MFDFLKGTIVSKQVQSYRGAHIVLDVQNIGYLIFTSIRTVQAASELNEVAKIYVSLVHREDSMSLCGFLTKEERDIFNILQSVSGVGVKLALLLLDEFNVSELINVVIREDHKELSRAKGVGPKLAQKVILELKDKLINWSNITPVEVEACDSSVSQDAVSEAQSVLLSLGYSVNEAKEAIKIVVSSSKQPKDSEDVLRQALEYLAQH